MCVRLSEQQNPQLLPARAHSPTLLHPRPQTLRPKCAVVFTSSGSHRLQVLLAALQGASSAPQQGEPLTGVWAGRTFRAAGLALAGSIFEGTPCEETWMQSWRQELDRLG